MKRLVLCFFLALTPLALCQEKEAAGHEETTSDPWIWWKWANFLILAGVLGYLINKNAGSYFRGQTEEIQRGILEASKLKAEAEGRAAQIEKRLAGIEGEVAQLRSQAHAEIAAEAARLKSDTQHLLERLEQQTQLELELMTKAAKHELKTFSAELALGLAEQRIRAMLDPASKESLLNAFIQDLHIQDLHDGSQHRSITQ
ncbi:MAG TPA: ATP synthase F0 subunit B [Bryobacteraceae bacterium]|nr:ATP synthase F0 subunit B [Bryobacteraceae bacterium]